VSPKGDCGSGLSLKGFNEFSDLLMKYRLHGGLAESKVLEMTESEPSILNPLRVVREKDS
jgi:hypothetical protein